MKRRYICLCLAILLTNCKKNSDTLLQDNTKPQPTAIGTETGVPVTKTIEPDGGTIISQDGRVELGFPAGSLSASTNISITTVTNYIPGGMGDVYSFGPDGTRLNIPATLKVHYTDEDISGSLPMFIGIAFQDADRIWYSLRHLQLDTINKTITATLPHFSHWGTFINMQILPLFAELKVNESNEFKVLVVDDNPPPSGDEELAALPVAHEVSPRTVKQWSANGVPNGNLLYGTITPDGSKCTFKAPAVKPGGSKNPVQLSADLDHLWYKDPATGLDFKNLKLAVPVRITDGNYSFHLNVSFNLKLWPGAIFYWTVTDLATMDIDVINNTVTITNIQNDNGAVLPASQTTPYGDGSCTATWQEDTGSKGYLDISKASGIIISDIIGTNVKTLSLKLDNKTTAPKFHLVCTGGGSSDSGGESLGTKSLLYDFILKDEIQITKDDPGITVTLTPK